MPVASVYNTTFHYHDQLEFDTLVEEIFKKRSYYVDLDTNTPIIIDAGAHIGMATLYLASLYPHAHYICIEPNPKNLALLHKNLEENHVASYDIIPKALVGERAGSTAQYFTGKQFSVFSSLQHGGWTGDEEGTMIEVETLRLSTLLTQPIDLLKMDIEGTETEVLFEAKDMLTNVKHLILEFHETASHKKEHLLPLLRNFFTSLDIVEDERRERDYHKKLYMIEGSI